MTTDREQYLLARCLRLEGEKAVLEGWPPEPILPSIERRSLYDVPLPIVRTVPLRRKQRRATPSEIDQMRELSTRGMSAGQIAFQLGMSDSTVRRYLTMETA